MDNVPFRLRLTGDLADDHAFEAYDGYMALAGFARTLTLVANYVEEGKIRQRGDFTGRHAVLGRAPVEGSLIADFVVLLKNQPVDVFGFTRLSPGELFRAIASRVIERNIGEEGRGASQEISDFSARKGGDIEALVAISETAIRQTHAVVGNGADKIEVSSGHNVIAYLDTDSKDYVNLNVVDESEKTSIVTVAAFNVNSGYGSVFDFELGRTVPITMDRDALRKLSRIFTWGLDQYSNKTGKYLKIEYTRILAMDGRPKRYIILDAKKA